MTAEQLTVKDIWEKLKHDPVEHPSHYTWHAGVECIDVAEEFNFNLGNVLKYVWRAGRKGEVLEDLKKAKFYLEREISRLGKEKGT